MIVGRVRRYAEVERNTAVNVRARREALGMSQDELARRMTERGFAFTQATVWKVEQMRRPVRVAEAYALADALGVGSAEHLGVDPSVFGLDAEYVDALQRAATTFAALRTAAHEYLSAQNKLAALGGDCRSDPPGPGSWLNVPAEQAIAEARRSSMNGART